MGVDEGRARRGEGEATKRILRRQGYHALIYLSLGVVLYVATRHFAHEGRQPFGLSVGQWVLLSWVFAGCHQASIVFFWRTQLYSPRIKKWLGKSAFRTHRILFVAFAAGRFLPLLPISFATRQSLPMPAWLAVTLVVATTPFILWGLYSVFFYFGITRTFGADHFDPAYRGGGLEARGIFRYVRNAMYVVILTAIYHPALFWMSGLGLVAAAVHHAFVWTHYFCTEKPDMEEIYGSVAE